MVRWMVRSGREITREEHEALLALADREARPIAKKPPFADKPFEEGTNSADASSCFGRLLFDIRCGKAERLEVMVRGGRFVKSSPSMKRRVVSPWL